MNLPTNNQTGSDVPARYRGLWRRSLLETADMRDVGTTVFWMQAAKWHADIRLPADRPDFAGVTSLAACSDLQLQWLATQQGFAGITHVREDARGEICTWHRVVDYQPPQATPDEGWMWFEQTRLVETGVHADYLEHWHAVSLSSGPMVVLQADGADSGAEELLFLVGQYVMHLAWPRTRAADQPGPQLEISFGERTASGYVIRHSTMPWLEGRHRTMHAVARDACSVLLSCDGGSRTWRFLESDGMGCGTPAGASPAPTLR